MTTNLERRLGKKSSGVLVPLIERYHKEFSPVHWDKDDMYFLVDLMDRVVTRNQERGPVFSPSMLGGCLRRAFLLKNYKQLGIPKKVFKKIETHFYFEYGNWTHLRLQVTLHKLHKRGEIDLLGTEIGVVGKRGDNAGTIDAVFRRERVFGVDIKGWNARDFQRLAGGDCPISAEIQLANYLILANAGTSTLPKLDSGLILAENKAGPISGYPAAVAEYEINLGMKRLVRERLGRLRAHEEEGTIPKAECQSTLERDFRECAFRAYCKSEVQRSEKRNAARRDSSDRKIKVATPTRTDRSRRHRGKRRFPAA